MISPLTLRRVRGGHCALLPGRVADIAGTQCGARQRLDLAQIIEADLCRGGGGREATAALIVSCPAAELRLK
jgi:hypothetical protein